MANGNGKHPGGPDDPDELQADDPLFQSFSSDPERADTLRSDDPLFSAAPRPVASPRRERSPGLLTRIRSGVRGLAERVRPDEDEPDEPEAPPQPSTPPDQRRAGSIVPDFAADRTPPGERGIAPASTAVRDRRTPDEREGDRQADRERELGPVEGTVRGVARGSGRFIGALGGVAQAGATILEETAREPVGGGFSGGVGRDLRERAGVPRETADPLGAPVLEALRGLGVGIEEFGTGVAEAFPKSPSAEAAFLEGGASNWRWYLENGVEQIPQLAASFTAAGLVAQGSRLAPLLAFAGPAGVQMGGIGYTEIRDGLIEQGVPEREAREVASVGAVLNGVGGAALEAAGPAAFFLMRRVPGTASVFSRVLADRMASRSARVAADILTGGATEATTEITQEALQATLEYASGADPEAFADFLNRGTDAFMLGLIVGGAATTTQNAARILREQQPEVFEAMSAGDPDAAAMVPEEIRALVEAGEPVAPDEEIQPPDPTVAPLEEDALPEPEIEGPEITPDDLPDVPPEPGPEVAPPEELGPTEEVIGDEAVVAPETAVDPEGAVDPAPTPPEGGAVDVDGERVLPDRVQITEDVPMGEPVAETRGAETQVNLPSGRRLRGHFAIVDARDAPTSHDPVTFQQTEGYPEGIQERRYHADRQAQEQVAEATQSFDADRILDPTFAPTSGPAIVRTDGVRLSGNFRGMITRRAAAQNPRRFGEYLQALEERADQFGLEPEQVVAEIERISAEGGVPELVRVVDDPDADLESRGSLAELMSAFNDAPTRARDPLADAQTRARRLRQATGALDTFQTEIQPDETLRSFLGTAGGRRFVEELVGSGVIPREEASRIIDRRTGTVNDEGKTLIERMMLAAAVGDPEVIDRAPPAWLRQVEKAVPAIVTTQRFEGWDVSPVLAEALDLGAAARAAGQSVTDLASQIDLVEGRRFSPEAEVLALFLEQNGQRATSDAFRAFAEESLRAHRQNQSDDLFGFEPKTPAEAFVDAFGDPGGETAFGVQEERPIFDLFGEPIERGVEQGDLLGGAGPEGISAAENRARATVSSLEGKVERGTATAAERTAFEDARRVLRRAEAMDAEDVRSSTRREGRETLSEDDTRDLFGEVRESGPRFQPQQRRLSIWQRFRRRVAGVISPELRREASEDELTGLPNRREEGRRVERALERRRGRGGAVRVVRYRVDLDNFKALNDTRGHAAGDRALRVVANVLRTSLRPGDRIRGVALNPRVVSPARVGGDEFALTLEVPEVANPAAIRDRLEREIIAALEREGLTEAGDRRIGASIGFAVAAEGMTAADLDQAADRSAIERKADVGRSRPRLVTPLEELTPTDQVEHSRATFGSEEEAGLIAAKVEQLSLDFATTSQIEDLFSVAARLERIQSVVGRRAWVTARGHTITGPEDVFRVVHGHRDPRQEVLQVLYLKKGRVVSHEGHTSGAIDYVHVGTGGFERGISERARSLGADQVIFSHNHPTGDPTPSTADLGFTAAAAQRLRDNDGPELIGHLVINHRTASWIELADGMAMTTLVPLEVPDLEARADWTDVRGDTVIRSEGDAARVAASVPARLGPTDFQVLYLDSKHRLIAHEVMAEAAAAKMHIWFPERLRELGAATTVFVTATGDPRGTVGDPRHVTSQSSLTQRLGRIARTSGLLRDVLDVVDLGTPDAPRVTSLRGSTGVGLWGSREAMEAAQRAGRTGRPRESEVLFVEEAEAEYLAGIRRLELGTVDRVQGETRSAGDPDNVIGQARVQQLTPEGVLAAVGRDVDLESAFEHFRETIAPVETIRGYLRTDRGRRFMRLLDQDGVIPEDLRGSLVDPSDGRVTEAGRQFAEQVVLTSIVGDPEVLEQAPVSWRRALRYVAPELAQAEGLSGWQLGDVVRAAIENRQANERGIVSGEGASPEALALARFLEENGPEALKRAMRAYVDTGRAARAIFEAVAADTPGMEPMRPTDAFTSFFGEIDLDDVDTGAGALGRPEQLASVPIGGRTAFPADPLAPERSRTAINREMYGKLHVDPEGSDVGRTNAPAIIRSYSEITEAADAVVPIRVGRLGTRSAWGVFKVKPEVIRVLQANDLSTAAHEVAHALEKAVFGWPKGGPWVKPRVGGRMQRELVALGRALYGDRNPAGGYKREGFAEYVRLWLTTDGDAEAAAPEFTAWFEGEFFDTYPDVERAFQTAKELTDVWRAQGSVARAEESMIDTGTLAARIAAAGRSARRSFSMEKLVEMGQPFFEIAAEAERRTGESLTPSEDPFITFSALRTTHATRTRYMVENGMIDLAGNPVGPALDDAAAIIKNAGVSRSDFMIYLWARRAIALWTDPHGARHPGISLEDARQVVEEIETPEVEIAAQKVWAWNEGVLDYIAEASPTFAQVVEAIRKRDPGFYVPLQREYDEIDSVWAGSGGGSARRGPPIQRLRGSGRRIKDPFPQMIANTERLIRQAHKRMVIDQLMRLSQIEGMGRFIEEVPVDRLPVATRSIADLLDQIRRELRNDNAELVDQLTELSIEADPDIDLAEAAITFFAPAETPGGGDPVIPVWDEGKVRWFHVDEKLFHALEGMDVYRLPDVAGLPLMEWLAGKPASLFRAGTTGLRASFGLVWNPARDVQTLMVNTQSSASGPRLFFLWMKHMAGAGLFRVAGVENEWMDVFVRLGGEMAQPLGQDIPHTRRTARRLFAGRAARTLDPRNWYDWYRDLVQFPESAPRVAELEAVARDIGWSPGQPMSLDQSFHLLLAAKQVTTDFTAAGEFARIMNRIAPFHNAAIQGPRANLRAMRRSPRTFFPRALSLTAVTLLLYFQHRDEDWWQDMEYRERWLHWHFPFTNPFTGEEELVRIPRAFEVGLVFSALPEMLFDSWHNQQPEQAAAWADVFIHTAAPNIMPVLLDEAIEQAANKDFFWDSPIVPMGEQRLPAAEQFNEYTSRAAIELGALFDVSPRRLDHAIDGIFGPVGGDLLDVLGLGPPEIGLERDRELADTPVIGRLFQRGGTAGARSRHVDEMYDLLEGYQRRQASHRHEETPTERRMRLLLTDATQATQALSYVRRFTPASSDRREISREIREIARDAVEAERRGAAALRGRFTSERNRAEALERATERRRQQR